MDTIPDEMFYSCSELKKITMPKTLNAIGDRAFAFCDFTQFDMPDTVVSIGDSAFMDCSHLKNIILSNDLRRIGDSAFANCDKLEQLVFPEKLNFIGMDAFSGTRFGNNWSPLKEDIRIEDQGMQGDLHNEINPFISDLIDKLDLTYE
jgi:hypothetical protein